MGKPFGRHPLLIMILLGIIVRLVISPFLSHPDDIASWGIIVEGMRAGEGLYDSPGYDYLPVWGYFLAVMSYFFDIAGIGTLAERPVDAMSLISVGFRGTVPTVVFAFGVKVFLTLADVGVGIVLYRLVKDLTEDEDKSLLACGLWMFLPPAVLVTAAGGMFDNISILFFLLSLLFIMRRQPVLSGSMLALTFTSKVFAAFAVFAMIFYICHSLNERREKLRSVSLFLGMFALVTVVILLPQILEGTFANAFQFITYRLTANGSSDGITLRGVAIIALVSAATSVLLLITYYMFRRQKDPAKVMIYSSFFAVGAIIVVSDNLQHYIIEVLPLVVLMFVCYEGRLKWPLVMICAMYLVRFVNEVPGMLFSLAEYTDIISVDTLNGIFSWQNNEMHDVYWRLKTNGKWLSNFALLWVALFVLAEMSPKMRKLVSLGNGVRD